MKLNFDKKQLESAVKSAFLVTPNKSNMPIIRNIKLFAQSDILTICATNCEIELQLNLGIEEGVKIIEEGSCLIECEKFLKVLKSIDNGDYTLQKDSTKNEVVINGIECQFSLNSIRSDEFPIFEEYSENGNFFEMNNLKEIFDKILFATRNEPSRYQMNGINLRGNEKTLDFVSTDTKRLALQSLDICNIDLNCILNTELCEIASKLINGSVTLSITNSFTNRSFIKGKNFIISAKLVNGIFPDYQKAIPLCDKSIIINKEKMIKTLTKLLPFTSDVTKSVKFNFKFDGTIFAYASLLESGEAQFSMKFENTINEEIEWNFNPKFLIEGLKKFVSEKITLDFKDSKRPLLMKADNGYTQLLMPVLARE